MAEYHGDLNWASEPLFKQHSQRENVIGLLLLLFVGITGAHRFYTNRPITGVTQLALFCIGVIYCTIFISLSLATLCAAVLAAWLLFDLIAIIIAMF